MGTTEAELRRNAEMERERMGETLDAIGDRLSPERMVERRKAAVAQRFRRMKESVMGSPDYEEPMSQRMRERTSGTAESVTDKAKSAASSASEVAHTAADKVQHAPEMVMGQARGNPLAAGLIAFGAGALFAGAFPKTRSEQHLVESARPQFESAKEELRGAGREMAADIREQSKEAAQEVTSTGKEAASHAAEDAKSSARKAKNQASR